MVLSCHLLASHARYLYRCVEGLWDFMANNMVPRERTCNPGGIQRLSKTRVDATLLSQLQGWLNRINKRIPRPLTNNDRSAEKSSRTITKGGRRGEPHSTGWMVRRSLDPRDLAISVP